MADFGAGTGAYTVEIAKRVDNGKVYAVDINQELLKNVSNDAQKNGLSNVEVLWGDIEAPGGSKLADGAVGLVVLSNVLFQTDNKEGVVAETKRVLKPGGLALVVEWGDSFGGLGPAPKDVLKKETVSKLFLNNGFALYNEIDAGEYHYGLLFRKF